jgi:hypothetical protein
MISSCSMHLSGAVEVPVGGVEAIDGGLTTSTKYSRWMSSSRSKSLRLVVKVDRGIQDKSRGGWIGVGEGGRLGQWDGSMVAGA